MSFLGESEEPDRVRQMAAQMRELYRELTSSMHVWPDEPPPRN